MMALELESKTNRQGDTVRSTKPSNNELSPHPCYYATHQCAGPVKERPLLALRQVAVVQDYRR